MEKKTKNAWTYYSEEQKAAVMQFCEGYRQFISENKTERECVTATVALAEAKGYVDLNTAEQVKPGDKVYYNMMGKALALFVVGSEPMKNGMKILGAHIDSPRLDLKQNTLYEDAEIALMDTHYYGGVKKYQWVAQPMAMHGVIVKKDGTVVNVVIGEQDGEPVVGISDLLIHLAGDQLQKKAAVVVEGEDLNVTVGSIPLEGEEKEAVKANVLAVLKARYDVCEDDFSSAEIEIVPAGPARNYGLDNSMIMGYGQDDRVCGYTSALALFEVEQTDRTAVCLLVDKEEIGSVGASSMQSRFFENCVAELMDKLGQFSELNLRRALQNSVMLSSDVSAAFDPNYPGVFERKNAAFFGKGLVFNKFTGRGGKGGSNDANPEFYARIRKAMEENGVSYQTAELGKVDVGGGGTIAYIMANYGMEVIDSGVAVQNMHAPWEVTSKADVYEAYLGYKAFLKEM